MVIKMRYEILDSDGNVVNIIIADAEFVEVHFPGAYRLVEDTSLPVPEPLPAPLPTPPSKEELLAQLQALQAQIEALEETPS
jgi:hypothetical protein